VALLERLLLAGSTPDHWLPFPSEVQQGLMGLISALARHVQDEVSYPLPSSATDALGALFSTLTHWSRQHRPGFVPGLSRRFGPTHGSWIADADAWWRTLSQQVATLSARESGAASRAHAGELGREGPRSGGQKPPRG
jgi:hypothetical protein